MAVGLNYYDHAEEMKKKPTAEPMIFLKSPSSLTSFKDSIMLPNHMSSKVDYEGELGVIIGKRTKNIKYSNATDVIFGYTIINDVTARKLQNNPIVTFAGKSYVKVFNYGHGMYDVDSHLKLVSVKGDKSNGALKVTSSAVSGDVADSGFSGSPASKTFSLTDSDYSSYGGSGAGLKLDVEILQSDRDAVNNIYVTDPGLGYAANETLTATLESGRTITVTITKVGDTLGGLPIELINTPNGNITHHSKLQNIGESVDRPAFDMDSFNIDLNSITAPFTSDNNLSSDVYSFRSTYGALETTQGGGDEVVCTRNLYYDGLHTMIPSTKVAGTQIFASCYRTGMSSPEDTCLLYTSPSPRDQRGSRMAACA